MLELTDGVSVSAAPNGSVDFTVDLSVYPLAAIFGCGYVFVDRWYVFLDKPVEGKVRVSLSPKAGGAVAEPTTVAADFQNELLSQALRHYVDQQHEKARESIMARALFGAVPEGRDAAADEGVGADEVEHLDKELAGSPDVPGEEDDFFADPLGIGVPWEQRFAGKADPAATPPAEAPSAPATDHAAAPAAATATDDAKKGTGGEAP
ncbi:MAG: hypothetical protein HY906_02935 [Deltaproteobacteria bacterium]|nr:hypothetical protein [Deltaproteobacteria bacterium]